MRGERLRALALGIGISGSSPHARGTRVGEQRQLVGHRIIPACAGNASWARSDQRRWPDHPRMRGERERLAERVDAAVGSSPHARGTLRRTPRNRLRDRIIPACAGNAGRLAALTACVADHPRMRGERYPDNDGTEPLGGSSPHARGTRCEGRGHGLQGRIIPACAGNADERVYGCTRVSDHPRMRGERSYVQSNAHQ